MGLSGNILRIFCRGMICQDMAAFSNIRRMFALEIANICNISSLRVRQPYKKKHCALTYLYMIPLYGPVMKYLSSKIVWDVSKGSFPLCTECKMFAFRTLHPFAEQQFVPGYLPGWLLASNDHSLANCMWVLFHRGNDWHWQRWQEIQFLFLDLYGIPAIVTGWKFQNWAKFSCRWLSSRMLKVAIFVHLFDFSIPTKTPDYCCVAFAKRRFIPVAVYIHPWQKIACKQFPSR